MIGYLHAYALLHCSDKGLTLVQGDVRHPARMPSRRPLADCQPSSLDRDETGHQPAAPTAPPSEERVRLTTRPSTGKTREVGGPSPADGSRPVTPRQASGDGGDWQSRIVGRGRRSNHRAIGTYRNGATEARGRHGDNAWVTPLPLMSAKGAIRLSASSKHH